MEKRLRISAHIPLQPPSRISAAKEKSCAKGLFDEKYNNNPKYSLIESLQIKSQAPNRTLLFICRLLRLYSALYYVWHEKD